MKCALLCFWGRSKCISSKNCLIASCYSFFVSGLFLQLLTLTLNAPITTKVVCFSRLLKCLRSLYGKKCGPRSDCSCSGSTLFASILNLSVMQGNYLQQMTSADDISRCIFFLDALRANYAESRYILFRK